jgi:hypothetical protein
LPWVKPLRLQKSFELEPLLTLSFFPIQMMLTICIKPGQNLSLDSIDYLVVAPNPQANLWHPVGFTVLEMIVTLVEFIYLKGLVFIPSPKLRIVNQIVQDSSTFGNALGALYAWG